MDNEQLLQTIFDAIPHWVAVKSPDGRFLISNKSFSHDIGIETKEIIGKSSKELGFLEDDNLVVIDDSETRAFSGELVDLPPMEMTLPNGEKQIRHTHKLPLCNSQGEITGTISISENISDRVALEEKFRQSQKMEAVGQLAGGVAHDFNNMLQAIAGFAELVAEDLDPDQAQAHDFIKEIQAGTERASNLTRQLLAFSRRQVLQSSSVDLNELVQNLTNMVRRLIGENITLDLIPAANLPRVAVDSGMMEQVLINLCVNARDAMPDGGRLLIETREAELTETYCQDNPWAKPGHYSVIQVSDSGVGIPAGIVEHIFEPFYTTKETGKGTGLGLAMAYGIIHQHNGMINVYSEEGVGTTFRIYLPQTVERKVVEEGEDGVQAEGGHETILIAEDEPLVLKLMQSILEKRGYRVISARDGEEAIRVFQESNPEIDLVLLDVIMPKISGRKAFNMIKTINPTVPVMFSTGYSSNMLDVEFLTTNNLRVIEKPIAPRKILAAIRDVLDHH